MKPHFHNWCHFVSCHKMVLQTNPSVWLKKHASYNTSDLSQVLHIYFVRKCWTRINNLDQILKQKNWDQKLLFMARCIWISPSVNVKPPLSIKALVCPPTFCWVQGKVWLLCQQNELTLQVEHRVTHISITLRERTNRDFYHVSAAGAYSLSGSFWIMKQGCQLIKMAF